MPAQRLTYVPALDGVRAAAVSAVMVSHFRPHLLPGGGLVGVTTFFALSGFLITSLLIREEDETGAIALGDFYRRRARRLLPALAVVVLAVLAWGAAVEHTSFVREAVPAVLYFGNAADWLHWEMGPFAHMWSLAVEEQFYLVWPLVFIGLRRRPVTVTLGVVVVLSLVRAALWLWSDQPNWTIGFDAILLGCAAAHLWTRGRLHVPAAVAWLGAALLAAFTMLDHTGGAFVLGGGTLIPLAALALIVHVTQEPSTITRALGLPPLVATGKISYGLYLWHWPIVVLLLPDFGGVAGNALGFVLSFVLAALSYRYVELPIRQLNRHRGAAPAVPDQDRSPADPPPSHVATEHHPAGPGD